MRGALRWPVRVITLVGGNLRRKKKLLFWGKSRGLWWYVYARETYTLVVDVLEGHWMETARLSRETPGCRAATTEAGSQVF